MLFLIGAIVGSGVSIADPGFQRFMLGGPMTDTIERREMWTHGIVTIKPLASSAILTNNLSVAFAAFAMGVTAGLGTAWMMVLNGLLIGVVGTACFRAGLSLSLWSFVAPHGSLELPAIFIAGGAGLILGRGLLDPGMLPRREALAESGGLGPSACCSASSRCSSSRASSRASSLRWRCRRRPKFVIGAAMLVLLVLYLTRAGRPPTAVPVP